MVVALDEVTMAAAVGVPDEIKGESIALFVVPAPGTEPDEQLTQRVFDAVDDTLGKAFHPKTIQWVDDLPKTRSQKIMRRVVKAIALGDDPGDLTSLENPASLEGIGQI